MLNYGVCVGKWRFLVVDGPISAVCGVNKVVPNWVGREFLEHSVFNIYAPVMRKLFNSKLADGTADAVRGAPDLYSHSEKCQRNFDRSKTLIKI